MAALGPAEGPGGAPCATEPYAAGSALADDDTDDRHFKTGHLHKIASDGFTLSTLSWLPLVSLDWQIVFPDYIDCRRYLNPHTEMWEESLLPQRRCRSSSISRLYTVSDVLGFCRFSWTITQPQPLLALPQTGHVRNLPLLRSLTAEDGISSPAGMPVGDRMDIRPYAPGDAVRNIMWNVYARTRHLNVRLAEKSVHHSNRTLAYLLSGPDDEAAAAVARIAVESGALGDDWVFGADGSTETTGTVATALALIAGWVSWAWLD